jgi:hypothetical protein
VDATSITELRGYDWVTKWVTTEEITQADSPLTTTDLATSRADSKSLDTAIL